MNDPLAKLQSPTASFQSVLALLRKRLWMILAIAVSVPAVAGFVVSKQPKVYEATSTIIIDASVPQYLGPQFKDVVELEANWWSAQETLQTELRVLHSLSQSTAVAKALCGKKLHKGRAIDALAPGIHCDENQALTNVGIMVQGLMHTEPQLNSRIVNIIANHSDPEMAALLANTIGEVYTERNLSNRLAQSEGAANWLGDEYGDLSGQLADAEKELIDFKKANNVVAVSLEDQQSDLAARHKKLSEELNEVQVKLITARAERNAFAQLRSNDPLEDVTPGKGEDLVLVKLKEIYLEQVHKLVELQGKYLDKHPFLVAQQARVAAARTDLGREAERASKEVEARYSKLMKQEQDLKVALEATTRDALQLEQRAIEYRKLKRNYDHLAKLSETVGGREQETSLAGKLKTNNVRPLDAALVPTAAVAPNVPRVVGAAFIAGLLLAFGLAFLLEMLDSTVKDQDDVEHRVGVAFLGIIPSIQPGKERSPGAALTPAVSDLVRRGEKDLYVLSHPKSALAECCRAIRTNLLFMSPDAPPKKILISSASSQEGKTTTAINMAIVLAQSGLRVLVVDSDMRRPRLHKTFGIPATPDGLSRAILGEAKVLEQVRETGVPNLWLLPCGATPPNPAELLHTERFRNLANELAANFDRVIFDSPPLGPVTDAAILARIVDGTILVAKFRSSSREGLLRVRRQLSEGGVTLLGCILNDFDLANGHKYGYYASRYGYYYAEGDGGNAARETAL
jgi:capsular exopolysaccharide synthesis family protein